MVRSHRYIALFAACGAFAFPALARAQAPGGAAGTTGTGGTTNAGVDTNTSATTMDASATDDNTPSTGGEAGVAHSDSAGAGGHDKLPNTGGEPLLMIAFGLTIAGSALLLRRKLA